MFAQGFGPGTFSYSKVSQVHGKVSLSKWSLESVPGFEPRILILMEMIPAPGFGPGTFGQCEVGWVRGEVSRFERTLGSMTGFEPGTLI